jgi:hypothetical protein
VALATASLIFSLLNGSTLYEMVLTGIPTTVTLLTQMVPFSVVGALIASQRPKNPIGWLFLAVGFFYGIEIAGEEYAISWCFCPFSSRTATRHHAAGGG